MSGNFTTGGSTPKKASSACTACQLRKSKCTGGVPCDKCQTRNTECIIDQDNDGRRKTALKRKQQEWEGDRALLEDLLKVLRSGNDVHFQQLVRMARNSSSWEEIKSCVNDQLGNINAHTSRQASSVRQPLDLTPTDQFAVEDENTRRLMDMNRFIDDPLYKVSALPWTTVSPDDHLVSHLVSLWFTWVSPTLGWINRSLFLQDMQQQKLEDAIYCSPFLVNAMLAHACPYSDYAIVKCMQGRPSRMMQHFLRESKRLLDEEEGRASLATLQGLGIMFTCVCALGKDRLGYSYARQIADMAAELVQKQAMPRTRHADLISDMSNTLQQTCWGLWMTTTNICLLWHKLPVMQPPACKRPVLVPHQAKEDHWTPYPVDRTESTWTAAHSACLFELHLALATIVTDCLDVLFSPNSRSVGTDHNQAISKIYERLVTWYKTIPHCLAISESSPLHMLMPHLQYHYIIILLCSFSNNFPKQITLGSAERRHKSEEEVAQTCAQSALEIARLLESYRSMWGPSKCSGFTIHSAVGALFALLNTDTHSSEHSKAFLSLCAHAHSSSRRWPIGRGLLRMVQLTIYRKLDRTLPSSLPLELERLFQDFENHIWRADLSPGESVDVSKEFSSFYPNMSEAVRAYQLQHRQDQATSEADYPIVEMDDFLQAYEASSQLGTA